MTNTTTLMYKSLTNQSPVGTKLMSLNVMARNTSKASFGTEYAFASLKKPLVNYAPKAQIIDRGDRFTLLHDIITSSLRTNYMLGPLVNVENVIVTKKKYEREHHIKQYINKKVSKTNKIKIDVPKYARARILTKKQTYPLKATKKQLVTIQRKIVVQSENEKRLEQKRQRYGNIFLNEENACDDFCQKKIYNANIKPMPIIPGIFSKVKTKLENVINIPRRALVVTNEKQNPIIRDDLHQMFLDNHALRNHAFGKIFRHADDIQLKSNKYEGRYRSPNNISRLFRNNKLALNNFRTMINRFAMDPLHKASSYNKNHIYVYDKHLFDEDLESPRSPRPFNSNGPQKRLQISEKNALRKEHSVKLKQKRNDFGQIQKRSIHIQVNIHPKSSETNLSINMYKLNNKWTNNVVGPFKIYLYLKQFMTAVLINNRKYIDKFKELLGIKKRNDSINDFPSLTHSDVVLYGIIQQRNQQTCDCCIEANINEPTSIGIINTRHDYYIRPNTDDLLPYVDRLNQTCFIDHFIIGRIDYGQIEFMEPVNVYNLNIDKSIEISSKSIDIYPNAIVKPPIGDGLNKKAMITLYNIWPTDKTTNEIVKDEEYLEKLNFRSKLISICAKRGFQFISYECSKGCWVFVVNDFKNGQLSV